MFTSQMLLLTQILQQKKSYINLQHIVLPLFQPSFYMKMSFQNSPTPRPYPLVLSISTRYSGIPELFIFSRRGGAENMMGGQNNFWANKNG